MSWLVALLAHLCRSRPHARRIALTRAVIVFFHRLVSDEREVFSPRRLARYARLEVMLQRLVRSLMYARLCMLAGHADEFEMLPFKLRRATARRCKLVGRLAGLHNTLVDIDRICRRLNRLHLLRKARRKRAVAARRASLGDGLFASVSHRAIAQATLSRPALDLSG